MFQVKSVPAKFVMSSAPVSPQTRGAGLQKSNIIPLRLRKSNPSLAKPVVTHAPVRKPPVGKQPPPPKKSDDTPPIKRDPQVKRLLTQTHHPVPARWGDMFNADLYYERWAEPNLIGRLTLRDWIGKEARKAGQFWPNRAELLEREKHMRDLPSFRDPSVVYPRYYRKQFHGYNSNFSEESVAQQASAMAIVPAIMTKFPVEDGWNVRRSKLMGAADRYKEVAGARDVARTRNIVDLGCGTGVSTRILAEAYPNAHVVGLDLSAPMLREAAAITNPPPNAYSDEQLQQLWLGKDPQDLADRISWVHANAEGSNIRSNSADLVTLHFCAHELPTIAMHGVAAEALRILRPGGWFALVENDQNVRNLHDGPEFLRWVAGALAREPHLPQYLFEDLEKIFVGEGFANVTNDGKLPGCTLVMGQKPQRPLCRTEETADKA